MYRLLLALVKFRNLEENDRAQDKIRKLFLFSFLFSINYAILDAFSKSYHITKYPGNTLIVWCLFFIFLFFLSCLVFVKAAKEDTVESLGW